MIRFWALLGFSLAATTAGAAELKPPFTTRAPDPRAVSRPCPAAPPAVIALDLPSKYGASGGARDRIDADAENAFADAMAPVKSYVGDVVKLANDYTRSGRASAASCALEHLARWASANALSSPQTHTGWFKLSTTLTGLSMAYLQIAPAVGHTPQAETVRRWLGARGVAVASYFDHLTMPRASRNNHRAWAGLAAASAGVAAQDAKLVAWGQDAFRTVACAATAEGALPLEIERGSRARDYHLYALAALTPLALILERNGLESFSACDRALERIAGFTLAALHDPARIVALAGMEQTGAGTPPAPSRLAFLEAYLNRFPEQGSKAEPWTRRQPISLTDLGGNQTLLYRRQ